MLKKLLISTIITLLFVVVVNAQSKQPVPSPGETGKIIQERSSSKQQPSQADQRGTEQFPLIIKKINPPKTQAEIEDERKDREEKATNDRHLVWFTGALVVATIILAFVAIWQGLQLKRSVDSLCHAERAYIFVTVRRHPDSKPGEGIEGIKEGYNQARIIATNHGKTPATIIKIIYQLGAFYDNQIDNGFFKMKSEVTSNVTPEIIAIKSGQDRGFTADCDITSQDKKNIDNSIAPYTCFGRIEYRDVFEDIHVTLFCWKDDGVYFGPDPDPKRNERT
jgi:hypothetical protein